MTVLAQRPHELRSPTTTMSAKQNTYLTPNSTPTKVSKSQRSRQRREPSGVFSLFQPNQVQLFREAFSLIDHDADGVVTEQDLKHIFASLGTNLLVLSDLFRFRVSTAPTLKRFVLSYPQELLPPSNGLTIFSVIVQGRIARIPLPILILPEIGESPFPCS